MRHDILLDFHFFVGPGRHYPVLVLFLGASAESVMYESLTARLLFFFKKKKHMRELGLPH